MVHPNHQEIAKESFHQLSGKIHIPHMVMELAAKLQLNSKKMISVEELVNKNPIIDEFIIRLRWKDQIVDDCSIPSDTNLGKLPTHWWTRLATTTSIPPTTNTAAPPNNPPPEASSFTGHQKDLPRLKVASPGPHQSQSRQGRNSGKLEAERRKW